MAKKGENKFAQFQHFFQKLPWNQHFTFKRHTLCKLISRKIVSCCSIRCINHSEVNYHSVENTEFYCHHAKISWNQLFTRELYPKLIWRKNSMSGNFSFFHTVTIYDVKKYLLTKREINYLSVISIKSLTWRKKRLIFP